jgi:hypothetical protein
VGKPFARRDARHSKRQEMKYHFLAGNN